MTTSSRQNLTDTPLGFRDVWWCWVLNEPGICWYPNGSEVPCCGCCDSPLDETMHEFIAHIDKPS